MNIAIVEYQNDIEEALGYFPPSNSLYLSVSSEASYYLSKKDIKFITDEDILTPEQFKTLGDENFEIVEEWVRQLEDIIQARNQLFKEKHFFPFEKNFYRLKILLDAVRIRKILLDKLIEKEKPSLIGMPVAAKPEEIHDHNLYFHFEDSLYGLLAQKIAAEKDIEVKIWQKVDSPPTSKVQYINDRIRGYLRPAKKYLKTALNMRYLFNSFKVKHNILLGSLGYGIDHLVRELYERYNFYFYENPLSITSLNSCLKPTVRIQNCKPLEIDIKNMRVDIKPTGDPIVDEILHKRIEAYKDQFIGIMWNGLEYLELMDSGLDFKAYIHIVGASDSLAAIPVYYFRRKNKPVFILQHGGYGFALNRHTEYCEFNHSGYFLAWGDGVKEMYEGRKKGSREIISTGSYLIEEIKRKHKPRKVIVNVCYIPCLYHHYVAYYPNGQPCLDSKLFMLQTNFLSILKPYVNRYRITYKISPAMIRKHYLFGKETVVDWLKENIRAIKLESRPLLSIIHKFDLFIIDLPTTTLVQTLATGAEVLVYVGNPYHTPSKDAIEILQKRAIIGYSEDDFKNKLKSVLDKGMVISDTSETTFLRKYGVHLDDGKSLERMANQIFAGIEKRDKE